MEINPFFSPLWNKTLPIFLLLLCCTSTENGLSFCKVSCILQSQHCYSSHATAANLGCQVKCDVETEKPSQRNTSSQAVNGSVDQKRHFEFHLEMKQGAAQSLERRARTGRRSGGGAGGPTLTRWGSCRSALSTLDMIGSSCKLSPVQRSQYIPDDEYDADVLEEKYISEEKNNYFSKQDNEAEPTLRGHKIEQNFWAMALASNKSPTWRSFFGLSLDISGHKCFQRYIKLKNYAFKPWFLSKGTDTLLCHSLQFSC